MHTIWQTARFTLDLSAPKSWASSTSRPIRFPTGERIRKAFRLP